MIDRGENPVREAVGTVSGASYQRPSPLIRLVGNSKPDKGGEGG